MFRTTSIPPPLPRQSLAQAPGDLLIEIALALESQVDILSLCLTSSRIYFHVASVLYQSVILKDLEQCSRTLSMLSHQPAIARHVREIFIELRSSCDCKQGVAVSLLASAAVRDAAATHHLEALTKFIWDADEKPYHEDMWFALRMGCPQLRYIGTSVGRYLPAHNSHLFDFVNLTGFSLTLKPDFYDAHMDTFFDEDGASSKKMWDMLILRCPNLEELIIEGVSSLPTDIHTVVHGRWPKLRKLVFGDVSIDWTASPVDPSDKRPFIAFLEAHPALETLSLSKYNVPPQHLSSIDPGSLHITSFTGTLQQLQALPYLRTHLKSVTFRDSMLTREVSTQAISVLLQSLSNLTELKIAFILHSMYDSGNLLRSLIIACPRLRQLDLTCGNKPSFQMDTFSKNIRGFPKLQSLHLTIVKYPGDEPLSAGAARIAKANPRLTKFKLTFIPPAYPLSLPFSLPHPPFPLPACSTGSFELTNDRHGLPLTLFCLEHFRLVWPWGLGVFSSSRRYSIDLRPLSAPGRRKKGWRGVLDILMEHSSAGEEMRMIMFCGLLVLLAIWGFLVHWTRDDNADETMRAMQIQRPPTVQGVLSFAPVVRMQAMA